MKVKWQHLFYLRLCELAIYVNLFEFIGDIWAQQVTMKHVLSLISCLLFWLIGSVSF